MILIISNNNDFSTGEVIRWLKTMKEKFLRLNEDDVIEIVQMNNESLIFRYNDREYNLNDFKSVWYRRGAISLELFEKQEYFTRENREMIQLIYVKLSKKRHINTYFNSHVNKLSVLSYSGFKHIKFPKHIITQSKSVLLDFVNRAKGRIISKPVYAPFSQPHDGFFYMAYTSIIDINEVKDLPEKFVQTFFQEYVEKKYEIRTFYLDDKFYSMCIFSQNNNKTTVDFRNYDKEKPNRVSPFKMPDYIEEDLRQMFKKIKLDCASLDLIYDGENFSLLDVNPVGQFGMVSTPCNYNLEQKIAKYLAN